MTTKVSRQVTEVGIPIHGQAQIVAHHADGTEFYRETVENLLTTAGRDWMHSQVYTLTTSAPRGSNFIALTTDTAAPGVGDSVLASEITTGGLARVESNALVHTPNTNQTLLAKTFTATATHTAIQKSGLFTASSAGTMTHEATFTPVTLNSSDTLTISWTVTLG